MCGRRNSYRLVKWPDTPKLQGRTQTWVRQITEGLPCWIRRTQYIFAPFLHKTLEYEFLQAYRKYFSNESDRRSAWKLFRASCGDFCRICFKFLFRETLKLWILKLDCFNGTLHEFMTLILSCVAENPPKVIEIILYFFLDSTKYFWWSLTSNAFNFKTEALIFSWISSGITPEFLQRFGSGIQSEINLRFLNELFKISTNIFLRYLQKLLLVFFPGLGH